MQTALFKLVLLTSLLNINMVCANDANDRTNTSEDQYWESSPARILLPRILKITNHFKKTFGNEPKKLSKVKSNECIRKNFWFHKKKSHQSGMDFLKKCFKQAFALNGNYRNSKSSKFNPFSHGLPQ